jgi:hypothetical protein
MTAWRDEVDNAIVSFMTMASLSGDPISRADFEVEYLPAPHRPPTRLPAGKMAVYGFWGDGVWLKIGMVGPKSKARFTSQHYNPGGAQSTLAGSLAKDPHMLTVSGFDPNAPGAWIKTATHRVNILLPSNKQIKLLVLLEAFLHMRLRPRYEG